MYIGIDLGGTNIAAGCVDEKGRILSKLSRPTLPKRGYEAVMRDMAETAKSAARSAGVKISDIKAVGIGSPGAIDTKNGVVLHAGNLKMKNVPIAAGISELLGGVPTHLENDANAAAYGEYIACGHDACSFVFITLGTGVGGGIVINKRIYRGFNGIGGEIGHMTLRHGGEQCTCGKRGCYECYASVTALKRQTERKLKECPGSLMNEWLTRKGRISGRTAFECAERGDRAAIEVRDKYIEYIAEGVVSVINIFQPEILMIGGGISKEGDNILKPLLKYVRRYEFNKSLPKTDIRIAALFNDAGIAGAAMAAMKYGGKTI